MFPGQQPRVNDAHGRSFLQRVAALAKENQAVLRAFGLFVTCAAGIWLLPPGDMKVASPPQPIEAYPGQFSGAPPPA